MNNYSEISEKVRELEQEKREFIRTAASKFNTEYYYPKLKELRTACNALGHKWNYSHLGPTGDPWFYCSVCHTSKCIPEGI